VPSGGVLVESTMVIYSGRKGKVVP
jgi:hypothetical protein